MVRIEDSDKVQVLYDQEMLDEVNTICERRDTSACDKDSEEDETIVDVQKINWNNVAEHVNELQKMSWGVPGAARAVRQVHDIFWEALKPKTRELNIREFLAPVDY